MIYETSYVIEGYDEKSAVFCFIEDIEKKEKSPMDLRVLGAI